MEKQSFDAVLKKSVVMFNMLTGNTMTEREGAAFLDIYDLVGDYHGADDDAVETFDVLSHIEPDEITPIPPDIPQFIGRSPAAVRAAVSAVLDCELGKSAKKHDIAPEVLKWSAQPDTADEYDPPIIRSESRNHIPGYDWQIIVLHREKDPDQTYFMHFAQMPTQAQLNEHFVKFHDRTHYVHVNEYVHGHWEGITDRYDTSVPTSTLTKPNPVVRTAPAPELHGRDVSIPPMSAEWEEPEKPWRIRYLSQEMGFVRFTYVDKKPTGAEMAHFHHTRCLAVSQAKPKD